jgi:peptide/nickel transport system substrate-binding protein
MAPTAVPAKTTLVVGQPNAPISFNPFGMGSWNDMPIISSICDSLFDFDYETSTLLPVLVEEWDQTDAVTWNLKLKEGLQFHKGYGEMTAEDWAFFVNTTIAEKSTPYFVFGSGKVAEAVVKDKYELEVHLTEPWAAFWVTSLITYGGFVFSKKAFEEMGAEAFSLNPIGCGPYELDTWTPGSDLVLKKFADYHDPDRPYFEEIRFVGVEDAVVRLEKLRAEEIDYTTGLGNKDMPDVDADPEMKVLWGAAHNYDVLRFNHTQTDMPWADMKVRQAMSHAVDRDQIIDLIYYGGAIADDDPLPAGFIGAEPDVQYYPNTADLDTARDLLSDAGYPDGFTMPCFTDDRENQRREIVLVADQLEKVGITLEIELTDRATSTNRLQNNEFDTNLGTWGMASPDSYSPISLYECGRPDANGYCNEDVQPLMTTAAGSLDRDEREDLYGQIVDALAEEAPNVWLCNVSRPYAMNRRIQGFTPGPLWLFPNFKVFLWEE